MGAGWPATAKSLVMIGECSKAGLAVDFAPCNSANCVAFMPEDNKKIRV